MEGTRGAGPAQIITQRTTSRRLGHAPCLRAHWATPLGASVPLVSSFSHAFLAAHHFTNGCHGGLLLVAGPPYMHSANSITDSRSPGHGADPRCGTRTSPHHASGPVRPIRAQHNSQLALKVPLLIPSPFPFAHACHAPAPHSSPRAQRQQQNRSSSNSSLARRIALPSHHACALWLWLCQCQCVTVPALHISQATRAS